MEGVQKKVYRQFGVFWLSWLRICMLSSGIMCFDTILLESLQSDCTFKYTICFFDEFLLS